MTDAPGLAALLTVAAVGCGGDSATDVAAPRMVDVQFVSEGTTLSGSLWLPAGKGRFPAMVVVHGSGRATRSVAAGAAGHFNQRGIAVLGYDKRGVGRSGGTYVGRRNASEENLTLLARDAAAGVALLASRDDVDGERIGLWGVSQAGWIVPMAAVFRPEVAFTILVSGPTVTVGEEAVYSRLTGDDSGGLGELSREEISRILAERGRSGFDPRPWLERMTVPGAWLLGDLDESIPIPETVAILDELIAGGSAFRYRVWPGANHALRVNGRTVDGFWEFQDEFLTEDVGLTPSREAPIP